MHEACLTFSDLTLGYNRHPAVHHLTGVVRKGSLTAIVGGNGSGKSTLMKGIVGLLPPMSGSCAVAAARVSPICHSSRNWTAPSPPVSLIWCRLVFGRVVVFWGATRQKTGRPLPMR